MQGLIRRRGKKPGARERGGGERGITVCRGRFLKSPIRKPRRNSNSKRLMEKKRERGTSILIGSQKRALEYFMIKRKICLWAVLTRCQRGASTNVEKRPQLREEGKKGKGMPVGKRQGNESA